MHKKAKSSPRQYPDIYEKIIPIALVAIGLTIFILMGITFGVIFNLL